MNKEGDHAPSLRALRERRRAGEMTGPELRLEVAKFNGRAGLSMGQACGLGGITEADLEPAPDTKTDYQKLRKEVTKARRPAAKPASKTTSSRRASPKK